MQVLKGHVSPETAYVVADYPYGFRLRCSIRYWIETHPTRGQRLMSQTTNPKKPGTVWNKPKASTYSLILVMYLDDSGYVQSKGIGPYGLEEPEIDAFIGQYSEALTGDYEAKQLTILRAKVRAYSKIQHTIISNPSPEQMAEIQANNARVSKMLPGMIAEEMKTIQEAK
jgi:hypothetical protein